MSLAAVLDAATGDTLLATAIALPTPADLLQLALTRRTAAQRFYFSATSYSSGSAAVPSTWSTLRTTIATSTFITGVHMEAISFPPERLNHLHCISRYPYRYSIFCTKNRAVHFFLTQKIHRY